MADQVEGVLRAADASAQKIRRQAEEEAPALRERSSREDERLAAARAEVDDLADRASRAAHEARDVFAHTLEDLRRMASELQTGIATAAESVTALASLAQEIASVAASPPASGDGSGEAPPDVREYGRAPRVRAVQMAMAGSSRAEIDAILRNEFGIDDTAPILDDALGAA